MITIPAGSVSSFQVHDSVNVFGDTIQEPDEMFSVNIEPVNALDEITVGTFTVTIEDDGDMGECS